MDLIVRSARRRHHADLVDIGIAEGRIQVGGRADLVVVDAPSVQEAYRTQPPRLAVIHDGRLVAERGRVLDCLRERPR
jgi:imidazolonepropionase-like amidohydrolase